MKFNRLFLFIFLSSFVISQNSFSIGFEDAIFPEFATSSRALALGNAYIAKVDDASAAFYNPAGLGTVRFSNLHINNLHIEANNGWLDTTLGGSLSSIFSNSFKGFSLNGIRDILSGQPDNTLSHSRFQAIPNLTMRYFSAGYLISSRQKSIITNDGTTRAYEYADRTDHGPYAALNISLFGGIIKLGASSLFLNRSEAIGVQSGATTVDVESSDYKKGSAVIITVGSRITLPVMWLPTFAATIHNAAEQNFSAGGAGAPDTIKRTIDLGFSITPQIGKKTRIHFEVDYKDFQKSYVVAGSKRIGMGMELDFSRRFFMRMGYGDGFGSYGLGVRGKTFEFDITSYAVDTQTETTGSARDRRYVLGISSGF